MADTIYKSEGLLINGELVATNNLLQVINPATEQVFSEVPLASEAELDAAVVAATQAQAQWESSSTEERQAMLNAIADCLAANVTELAEIITKEQGKPLAAATMEVQYAEGFCRYFASQSLSSKIIEEDDTKRIEAHHQPLGVVAGILPWNFPLLIGVYKIAPALLTGNSIIIKPAPTTPTVMVRFCELLKDVVPAGLVNVIVDNNNLGPKITSHPGIAKVSFTGSTPTGKNIMASAAGTLKRITLELGGNDAGIVLDDADPKAIAAGIFGTAFINSGQVCIALKRLYVDEKIYDQVCEEIAVLARNAVVGDGMDPSSEFGPVQNKMQYEKVLGYIADAKANGNIIAGGDIPQTPGYFVPLTVVKDIKDGTKVVDEEPFGPVLPIIKYSSLDDAIAKANGLSFGLGASVWSSNLDNAQSVAARIKAGTVWINQHCVFGPNIPFPTCKESGIGVEFSEEGLLEFTHLKVININKV